MNVPPHPRDQCSVHAVFGERLVSSDRAYWRLCEGADSLGLLLFAAAMVGVTGIVLLLMSRPGKPRPPGGEDLTEEPPEQEVPNAAPPQADQAGQDGNRRPS